MDSTRASNPKTEGRAPPFGSPHGPVQVFLSRVQAQLEHDIHSVSAASPDETWGLSLQCGMLSEGEGHLCAWLCLSRPAGSGWVLLERGPADLHLHRGHVVSRPGVDPQDSSRSLYNREVVIRSGFSMAFTDVTEGSCMCQDNGRTLSVGSLALVLLDLAGGAPDTGPP